MLRKLNVLAAGLLALGITTGCAGNRGAADGPLPLEPVETRVQVRNNNWADMTVYVESNGTRSRLGTVTSTAARVFRIPRMLLASSGTIRLVADPIGPNETFVTQPLQVWAGQRVQFSIENHLAISSVSVR